MAEKTTRFGLVMQIYRSLSQQQEDEIDRRFAVTVDTMEIVQAGSHAIERIIFCVDFHLVWTLHFHES